MKRAKFSLSNYKLFSGNMGNLIPIGLEEVLPGDTFQHTTSALLRFAPMLAPVMHPTHVTIHHWFVPTRLLWDEFEEFITGQTDETVVAPFLDAGTIAEGSLGDYLGLPLGDVSGIELSALPFRAYALIFNEWYRDQDLVDAVGFTDAGGAGGADSTTNQTIQNVAWEKDYFTTARLTETKSGFSYSLFPDDLDVVPGDPNATPTFLESDDSALGALRHNSASSVTSWPITADSTGSAKWDDPALRVDPTQLAAGLNFNNMREYFALERFGEMRARYGSRYTEYLRALGVNSADSRLQRPEYLGGGKQTVQFSEVLQTAPTTSGSAAGVGELKGHGIVASRTNKYRRFFSEHGYVMSLFSVKPKTMYVDGIRRMWSRTLFNHYWQKELQHIGQQEVLNKEIYAAHTSPEGTFGFQDRYDEYRRSESTVAGEFRDTLDYWHLARSFGSDPTLNADFVTSNPATRIFASTATDTLRCMAVHHIQARRLVAKRGNSYLR